MIGKAPNYCKRLTAGSIVHEDKNFSKRHDLGAFGIDIKLIHSLIADTE